MIVLRGLQLVLAVVAMWAAMVVPPSAQQQLQPFAAATQGQAAPPAAKAQPAKELELNARQIPLGGALKSPRFWQVYKARFISVQGRIIDTANGMISHSEGQGYGMLFAVAANDRETFDRIWGWTRANLMVRNDELMAWRWEPAQRPAIADMNNATDGDILVAWALVEASELWSELSYRIAARRIAVDVGRKTVLFKTKMGALLLPAISGFSAQDRPDGPIVNLSYYVFPAFPRLKIVAPEYDWNSLTQSGLDLLKAAQSEGQKLPGDWLSVKDGKIRPADGFAPHFSYNAIRIPLYLAWAGIGEREHYREFFKWAANRSAILPIVDVKSGREAGAFREPGYSAVAQLLECVVAGGKTGAELAVVRDGQNYYPATLHMMALIAAQMRYATCVRL